MLNVWTTADHTVVGNDVNSTHVFKMISIFSSFGFPLKSNTNMDTDIELDQGVD